MLPYAWRKSFLQQQQVQRHVCLVTAAAGAWRVLHFCSLVHPHHHPSQCSLLRPPHPCEAVSRARTSYLVGKKPLGKIQHNCSQPLVAFWNQGIFKSLWSEHTPVPTPESGYGPIHSVFKPLWDPAMFEQHWFRWFIFSSGTTVSSTCSLSITESTTSFNAQQFALMIWAATTDLTNKISSK